MSDPGPSPDEVPDVATVAVDPPAEPVGVTPGSELLAPESGEALPVVSVPVCGVCGHAVQGHGAGRCLIMLGEFGTEGPCPCGDSADLPSGQG